MVQTIQPSTAESPLADFSPSLENSAVALCTEVWQKIHAATPKRTRNVYTAERCVGKAFRLAMPPLSGYQNICDFQTRTAPRLREIYPTPPPLLPQPNKNKGINSKTPFSPPPNKGLTT